MTYEDKNLTNKQKYYIADCLHIKRLYNSLQLGNSTLIQTYQPLNNYSLLFANKHNVHKQPEIIVPTTF